MPNNGKTTIFVDYTRTGNSLKSFEDLALIDKYWENLGIKKYSFMPKLDISDIGKVKEIIKNFKPSEETCKFLLQAIDVMKTSRKI